MADLFEKTGDSGYAMSRVLHYQQTVHSAAGPKRKSSAAGRPHGGPARKDPVADSLLPVIHLLPRPLPRKENARQ